MSTTVKEKDIDMNIYSPLSDLQILNRVMNTIESNQSEVYATNGYILVKMTCLELLNIPSKIDLTSIYNANKIKDITLLKEHSTISDCKYPDINKLINTVSEGLPSISTSYMATIFTGLNKL